VPEPVKVVVLSVQKRDKSPVDGQDWIDDEGAASGVLD
jgi:hypothetical protein